MLKRYRKDMQPFLTFIFDNKYWPETPAEFDDLLVEWRHSRKVKKSTFEGAVAAVEFALPSFKSQLPWSRAVIHSWGISHVSPGAKAQLPSSACTWPQRVILASEPA